MATVKMTQRLYRSFPQLENQTVTAPSGPVSNVLRAVNDITPGFTAYVLDDRGALRRHVHLDINNTLVVDRKTRSDHAPDGGTVYILQALNGS